MGEGDGTVGGVVAVGKPGVAEEVGRREERYDAQLRTRLRRLGKQGTGGALRAAPDLQAVEHRAVVHFEEGERARARLAARLHPAAYSERLPDLRTKAWAAQARGHWVVT
jgi:hypothetical protein